MLGFLFDHVYFYSIFGIILKRLLGKIGVVGEQFENWAFLRKHLSLLKCKFSAEWHMRSRRGFFCTTSKILCKKRDKIQWMGGCKAWETWCWKSRVSKVVFPCKGLSINCILTCFFKKSFSSIFNTNKGISVLKPYVFYTYLLFCSGNCLTCLHCHKLISLECKV